MPSNRGTTNTNARGNTRDRATRRRWVLREFGDGTKAPCVRCGVLVDADTLYVDRIVPGVEGGRYVHGNIQPHCGPCSSETGAELSLRRRGLL